MELLKLIRDKKVMVDAINFSSDAIETPWKVTSTLREALKYVDTHNLYLCTSCGMVPLACHVANKKLAALSAWAEIICKELGLK